MYVCLYLYAYLGFTSHIKCIIVPISLQYLQAPQILYVKFYFALFCELQLFVTGIAIVQYFPSLSIVLSLKCNSSAYLVFSVLIFHNSQLSNRFSLMWLTIVQQSGTVCKWCTDCHLGHLEADEEGGCWRCNKQRLFHSSC